MSLEDKIYKYPTKYKEGFLPEEIEELLKEYDCYNFNEKRFNEALNGITCMMREGKILTYHCDVLTALKCGIENRKQKLNEWD